MTKKFAIPHTPVNIDPEKELDGSPLQTFRYGSGSGSGSSCSCSCSGDCLNGCTVTLTASGGGTTMIDETKIFSLSASPGAPDTCPCCHLSDPIYSFEVSSIQKRNSISEDWQPGSGDVYILHEDLASPLADAYATFSEPGIYRITFAVTALWTGTTDNGNNCGNCEAGAEATGYQKAVELEIHRDSQDITDTTQTVIVGEGISLSIKATPPLSNNAEYQWTIPGEYVKDYSISLDANNQSASKGEVVYHTQADFTKSQFHHYWCDEGSNEVSISVTDSGETFTAEATFNVLRPVGEQTATTTTLVPAVDRHFKSYLEGYEVSFGYVDPTLATPSDEGIEIKDTITLPDGYIGGGKIGEIQTVNTITRYYRYFEGMYNVEEKIGVNVLDPSPPDQDDIFYNGARSLTSQVYSPQIFLGVVDTPGESCKGDCTTRQDNFRATLMFKPDADDAIWVPLSVVKWHWKATFNQNSVISRGNSDNPPGENTTEFPQWNGTFETIESHSELTADDPPCVTTP